MKKYFIIISILLFTFIATLIAKTAQDYVMVLENISDKCKHGRQVIWRDTNGDGDYDTVRKTNCDGSYTESPMKIELGGRSGDIFYPIGAGARITSGDYNSQDYTIEIYWDHDDDPETDNKIVGWLVSHSTDDPSKPDVTYIVHPDFIIE